MTKKIDYGESCTVGVDCVASEYEGEELIADLLMGAIIIVVIGSVILLALGWLLGLVGRVFMKGLGR